MAKKTKICNHCEKKKPIDQFSRNCTKKDGRDGACKVCMKAFRRKWRLSEKGKVSERKYRKSKNGKATSKKSQEKYMKKHRGTKKYKDICRERHLKYDSGITPLQYNEMLKQQGGGCAICGGVNASGKRLAVDHCHTTGKIRGLLCTACNSGLGHFHDDINNLASAIKYLSREL